jgi:hypothetical protein
MPAGGVSTCTLVSLHGDKCAAKRRIGITRRQDQRVPRSADPSSTLDFSLFGLPRLF